MKLKLSKELIALGILTAGVATVSVLGSKKAYKYVDKLKKAKEEYKTLYYDKLTKDDVAWG